MITNKIVLNIPNKTPNRNLIKEKKEKRSSKQGKMVVGISYNIKVKDMTYPRNVK